MRLLSFTTGAVGSENGILHTQATIYFNQPDRPLHLKCAGPDVIRLVADLLNDGRTYRSRIFYFGILKQDDESVTTDATYMTAAIRRLLYAITQLLQDFVSGLMPE